MEATAEQIELLDKLQEVDKVRLRSQKAAAQLSQRAEVIALRKSKADVQAKLDKVDAMYDRETRQLDRIEVEDRQLAEKQQKVQEKIDGDSGDFRAVATWTRDLEGMVKRRNTLERELGESMARLEDIEKVRTQAQGALDKLERREAELVADYCDQSEQLRVRIEQCYAAGRAIAAKLPGDLLEEYSAAVKRCGGIGIAHLEDGRCSACRQAIAANRLPELKRRAPLAECPACRRLLVVDCD